MTSSHPDDDIIAYHEAGHAVVAIALGFSVRTVWINPNDFIEPGKTVLVEENDPVHAAGENNAEMIPVLEKHAKLALAGPIAQLKWQPDTEHSRFLATVEGYLPDGWGKDIEGATTKVASIADRSMGIKSDGVRQADVALRMQIYERLRMETEAVVLHEWPAIVRVAERLKVQRSLNSEEVARLTRVR